jgi:hypothetical protein
MITHTHEQLVEILEVAGHKYNVGHADGYAGNEKRSKDREYSAGYRDGWKAFQVEQERVVT